MKKALILGISGQDGYYLTKELLDSNYKVFGMVRRHSVSNNQTTRINSLINEIELEYGDLLDANSVRNIFKKIKPDVIFNLAAMSQVKISNIMPSFTIQTNGLAVLNILEIIKESLSSAVFYQASSSEMFGNSVDKDKFQRLTTPMNPVSPYGCSKLLAYHLVKHYRNAYKLNLRNGILFNHESPLRGENFVTAKVVKTAVEIKKGLKNKLVLGNIDSYRDWGHSKDYVKAIRMIVEHDIARDWIVSTGKSKSIRDMCEYVFSKLNLDYQKFVEQDNKFFRSEELNYLKGDSSDTRNILGWKPTYSFEQMLDEMIDHWMKKI